MAERLIERFILEDLQRVEDLVGRMKERVVSVIEPSPEELWERRLIARHIRNGIRAIMPDVKVDQERWSSCLDSADLILLENFTRQVSGGFQLIRRPDVKQHDYVTAVEEHERRTYMGLHYRPFDHEGLSTVVAYKPTLHEQPYHAHARTDENSIAIHPTTGLGLIANGEPASILQLSAGEMVNFKVGTPHTLKNPTNIYSADASVKMPQALGDRIPLEHTTITAYLDRIDLSSLGASKRTPEVRDTTGARKHLRYTVFDCGLTYRVDYVEIDSGQEVTHFDIDGIAKNTAGLITVFTSQKHTDAEITVGGPEQEQTIQFGDWLVINDESSDGVSLNNRGKNPSIVYLARQIDQE